MQYAFENRRSSELFDMYDTDTNDYDDYFIQQACRINALTMTPTKTRILFSCQLSHRTNERTDSFGRRLKPLCPIHQERIEIT